MCLRSLRGLLLLILTPLTGCQIVHDYLRFRALDLVDCAKLSVGYGIGIAVDVRATDWFSPGLGYLAWTTNFGWDDRDIYGSWEECVVINTPRAVIEAALGTPEDRGSPGYDATQRVERLALASVFLANERWLRNHRTQEVTVDFYSMFNFAPVASFVREADPGRFFVREGESVIVRDKGFWDQGWFEAGATAGVVSARVGLNVFQIVDFAVGLFLLDPAGDDRRLVPARPPPREATSF